MLRKPNSVAPVTRCCDHSSGTDVAAGLVRPTRRRRRLCTRRWSSRQRDGRPASRLPIWSCSAWGLPCLVPSPDERCALTAPFHPYPLSVEQAVCSLWHFPSRHRASPLASMQPVGVRTFLPSSRAEREGRSPGALRRRLYSSALVRDGLRAGRAGRGWLQVCRPQPLVSHERRVAEKPFFWTVFFFLGPEPSRSSAS